MEINYLLLAIMGVLSVTGLTDIVKGSAGRTHPLRTIGAVVVFVLLLIATLRGIELYNLQGYDRVRVLKVPRK